MRTFDSGATRDSNDTKPDYRGFISPMAMKVFGEYMQMHQKQADGTMRASDNWKKGIPIPAYVESLIRHTIDFWAAWDAGRVAECDELACALFFNVQGFIHERSKVVEVAAEPLCQCGCGLTERRITEIFVEPRQEWPPNWVEKL